MRALRGAKPTINHNQMKKIINSVTLRWEGDEPIRARVIRHDKKVNFEKGTEALADSEVAQALIGRYKKFVVVEESTKNDDGEVVRATTVKPKKTKRVAKK